MIDTPVLGNYQEQKTLISEKLSDFSLNKAVDRQNPTNQLYGQNLIVLSFKASFWGHFRDPS